MKKLLVAFGALNVLLMVVLFALIVLSELYPLHPGGPFYSVQDRAEQWRLRLSSGEVRRAEVAMDLAERRLADLASAREPDRLRPAGVALQAAVEQSSSRIQAAPKADQDTLYGRFKTILAQAEVVLTGVAAEAQAEPVLVSLTATVLALQQTPAVQQATIPAPRSNSLAQAEPIPFLGSDVEHDTYPLLAGHKDLECEACHTEGKYVDTARDCEGCHEAPASTVYAEHFAGACEDCHVADDWAPELFDHAGVVECESCHLDERPADHYARPRSTYSLVGQPFEIVSPPFVAGPAQPDRCVECHTNTADWQVTDFDHAGYDDCQACHEARADLDGHYEGECAACHTTESWEPLDYDHAEGGECAACHQLEIPADHYWQPESYVWYAVWMPSALAREVPRPFYLQQGPETCSNCHVGTDDWQQVSFDHTGTGDCATCHVGTELPTDHPDGACADCHLTADWQDMAFDHAGGNCVECHAPEADHYEDNCALCHNAETWQAVVVDHSRLPDCADCHTEDKPAEHYSGQCSRCHNTVEWVGATPDHADMADCQSCHSNDDHYRGQCSQCHNTVDWNQAWFSHDGYRDCNDCHRRDAPAAHFDGQCSTCHSTDDWGAGDLYHSGRTNCSACHTAPTGHYSGACQGCHNTGSWDAVAAGHSGLADCVTCHAAPAGHYNGTCTECHGTDGWATTKAVHNGLLDCTVCHSAPGGHLAGPCVDCHDTSDWQNVDVTHQEWVDCVSCHAAPAAHWPGQCSDCHDTTDWAAVDDEHNFGTDCAACHPAPDGHYDGQCSNCHGTASWLEDINFLHEGLTNCTSCHPSPTGHWPGECSSCHDTEVPWEDAIFNHTGYTNCVACHTADRPAGHPRGQCSKCHSDQTWTIATPTPELTPGTDGTSGTPTATPSPYHFGSYEGETHNNPPANNSSPGFYLPLLPRP